MRAVTLPRTLPFKYSLFSLPLLCFKISPHIKNPTSNQTELLLCAEELKKKLQQDQLENLTPRASGNLCHRNAALLCNLVPLKKNKSAFKKIHLHIAYIYS